MHTLQETDCLLRFGERTQCHLEQRNAPLSGPHFIDSQIKQEQDYTASRTGQTLADGGGYNEV